MFNLIFILLGLFHLVMAILTARLAWERKSSYAWLAAAVALGLTYDSLIIGLGATIGEGALLKTLNAGRYWLHAIATPWLMIFAYGVARQAGVRQAQSRRGHILVCLLTSLMMLHSAVSDIFLLDLVLRDESGVLRYYNEGGLAGPPLGSIVTILYMLTVGFLLWRQSGYAWLLGGALVMFLAAGAGAGVLLLGNLGEAALTLSDWLAARRFIAPTANRRTAATG